MANREDPDEMPHRAAFHLGLHCLLFIETIELEIMAFEPIIEKNAVIVQELNTVLTIVFDLAQHTYQKRFDMKCNPEIFCDIPRYFVQSNCGSSFYCRAPFLNVLYTK